uniref:PH domain-containing protein n=1 Tax=Eutreptiella gymnastica TaxID=73025 RepID=A0A7S1NCN1_9EUGL|mmetsp:Transcript_15121/g.26806  ORF Transcript_15121/g.26806 Transcript_15121/m.26806 type:complete len:194 (+) Transcript_15121:1-582(+)
MQGGLSKRTHTSRLGRLLGSHKCKWDAYLFELDGCVLSYYSQHTAKGAWKLEGGCNVTRAHVSAPTPTVNRKGATSMQSHQFHISGPFIEGVWYLQASSLGERIKWMRALTEAARHAVPPRMGSKGKHPSPTGGRSQGSPRPQSAVQHPNPRGGRPQAAQSGTAGPPCKVRPPGGAGPSDSAGPRGTPGPVQF